jgi:concanavalin A-like lectin/glucanase superfamily protein
MSDHFLRIVVLLTIFVRCLGGLDLTLDVSEAGEVSTFKDEFNGQTLGSEWLIWDGYALNSPADPYNHATFGTTGSHLSISFPGGAEHNQWWLKHAQVSRVFEGSGVYEIKVNTSLNGSQQFGLIFESGPGTFMIFMLYANSTVWGYVERFANIDGEQYRTTLPGSGGSGYNTGLSVPDPGPYWLRVIVKDDPIPTNRHWTFEWSADGEGWETIIDGILEGSESWSNIGTIQRVGVFAGNQPDFYSAFDARFDYYRTFPIAALPIRAPGNLVASAGDQQVILAWDAVHGAEGYYIHRSMTLGETYTFLTATAGTSYIDTGLVNEVSYAYVVTAYANGSESAESNKAQAVPHMFADPGVLPTDGRLLLLSADELAYLLDNGDVVTQWTDAFGSPLSAFVEESNAPTFVADAISGHAAVRFDGQADHLRLATGFADFTAGMSLFVVARPSALQAGAKLVLLGNGAGQANLALGRHGDSAALQYFTTNSSGHYAWFATDNALSVQEAALYAVVQEGGAVDSQVAATVSKNGAVMGSNAVYVPPVEGRGSNYIGKSYWASDGYFQGDIAEIILYNRALPVDEQAAVRAYLAAKYELSVSSYN